MSDQDKNEKAASPKVSIETVLGKDRMTGALGQPRAVGYRDGGPEGLLKLCVDVGVARHPENPEAAACAGAMQLLQLCGSRPDLPLLKRYSGAFASPRLAEQVDFREAKEKLKALAAKHGQA